MAIHPTAEVSPRAKIGTDTSIWHQAQVREGARIGSQCILGKGSYVDKDVVIGDRVKIQNYASIYHGATVANGVFIGPYACVSNDRYPRAVTADGKLKLDSDWVVSPVRFGEGASLGAGSIILPGVSVGAWSLVGAGSVVSKDVPAHGLVAGNPAKLRGFVCKCGKPLPIAIQTTDVVLRCSCGLETTIPAAQLEFFR